MKHTMSTEQDAMKAVVDAYGKSFDEETRQQSAYKALEELKKIRIKQRAF